MTLFFMELHLIFSLWFMSTLPTAVTHPYASMRNNIMTSMG